MRISVKIQEPCIRVIPFNLVTKDFYNRKITSPERALAYNDGCSPSKNHHPKPALKGRNKNQGIDAGKKLYPHRGFCDIIKESKITFDSEP